MGFFRDLVLTQLKLQNLTFFWGEGNVSECSMVCVCIWGGKIVYACVCVGGGCMSMIIYTIISRITRRFREFGVDEYSPSKLSS